MLHFYIPQAKIGLKTSKFSTSSVRNVSKAFTTSIMMGFLKKILTLPLLFHEPT
jgi:hypothetical protein